ncbi:MAG: Gfo/Idh/MocA family oxidoreductase [Armatimonadetes bacterium]|nr:Gfo/Idh/MocA family oxidoreductase [Armatimonadota bacterium]
MAKTINIGLVGYKFMGKAHSNAYRQVTPMMQPDLQPIMKCLCGRNAEGVAAAARQMGWEQTVTDWHQLVASPDIDLVDICTPSGPSHTEIALEAAQHGKHIFCEKPLAASLSDARAMLSAVEQAGVRHMVNFNYRRCPAVALAKKMIGDGLLGDIYHWRSVYLQDWIIDPDFPLVWRLDKSIAGSGPLGDLAAHSIDLAHFLVGPIAKVVGMEQTFVHERPVASEQGGLQATGGVERAPVTVEDAVAFLARFENGVFGTFEATRFAAGRKNYNRFEVNGSRGSLCWNMETMNELEYYDRSNESSGVGSLAGFRLIQATDGSHPYMGSWWPPAHIIGYEHGFIHGVYDLLNGIGNGTPLAPDFRDGARCQAVLEAVTRSIAQGGWTAVEAV